MFKKIAIKSLAVVAAMSISTFSLASTSGIDSFHQVLQHPTTGADIYVQVDLKDVDSVAVTGYSQYYANASGSELRTLNTGERVITITCRVSTNPNIANGTGSPDATFSMLIEDGRDYELYPNVYEVTSGSFSWTLCNPGIRPKL